MIFKQEMVDKILDGSKTVTRRPVKFETVDTGVTVEMPCRYKVGHTYAVQPGRGKKAVGRIRILKVSRLDLSIGFDGGFHEARREGFASWNDFREYWIGLYGSYNSTQLVDRIEFELVEGVGS